MTINKKRKSLLDIDKVERVNKTNRQTNHIEEQVLELH
jgi:hypothetical protein